MDAGASDKWSNSPDQEAWQTLVKASEGAAAESYRARLTEHLGHLMCRPRFADGAVAAGIARRAMRPGFKGDTPALYERLNAFSCPASKTVGPAIMRDLGASADAAKAQ
jgi:hypothetical protein